MADRIDPRETLKRFCAQYRTKTAAADALKLSLPYLSDLLAGNRTFSDNVLAKLGLKRDSHIRKARVS